jgi:hypothetical protein
MLLTSTNALCVIQVGGPFGTHPAQLANDAWCMPYMAGRQSVADYVLGTRLRANASRNRS